MGKTNDLVAACERIGELCRLCTLDDLLDIQPQIQTSYDALTGEVQSYLDKYYPHSLVAKFTKEELVYQAAELGTQLKASMTKSEMVDVVVDQQRKRTDVWKAWKVAGEYVNGLRRWHTKVSALPDVLNGLLDEADKVHVKFVKDASPSVHAAMYAIRSYGLDIMAWSWVKQKAYQAIKNLGRGDSYATVICCLWDDMRSEVVSPIPQNLNPSGPGFERMGALIGCKILAFELRGMIPEEAEPFNVLSYGFR